MNCVKCGNNTTSKCKRCLAPYCSRECQLLDWPNHKIYCTPINVAVDGMLNKILGNITIFQTYYNAANVYVDIDDNIYSLNIYPKPCKITISRDDELALDAEFMIFLRYNDYNTQIKHPINDRKFKKKYIPAGDKWTILI